MKPALLLLLGLCLAAPASGAAAPQEPPPSKAGFIVAPVVYYTPETRIAWGFVGIHYFRLFTPTRPSRLSSYRFNVIRTQNKQTTAQVDWELYFAGDDFLLDGTAKFSYYPNRLYGTGNRTREEDREDYTSRNWRLQLEPQVRVGESVYAGVHLETQSIDIRSVEPGGMLESGAVLGGAGGSINGLGLFAKWDSRDNTFSTTRGAYGAVFLNRYLRALGGDYAYTQLSLDGRLYRPLGRSTVLAAQAVFKSVWGGCPFQALPMFGGLNLLRGYYDGRYRDRAMLALQAECRLSLNRRVGLCGFAGVAQVQQRLGLLELDGFHAAAGAGVRYRFNPREKLVIRLDAGFAGPKPAFYLTFAEAF